MLGHKSVMEILEKMISPVLYGTNRSFKRQNTISLKTGVLSKFSEMRRLQQFQIFLPEKVLSGGARRRVGNANELNCSMKRKGKRYKYLRFYQT